MINLIKKNIRKIKLLFKIYIFTILHKRRLKKMYRYVMKDSFYQPVEGVCLDKLVELHGVVCRMGWDNKKYIPEGQSYYINPDYGCIGEYKYNETDASLRKIVLEKINERRTTR